MISILLASYNGEKYISEQIESLLNQTYKDFIIYITDDCSTDGTYEIEKEFEQKYPEKIRLKKRDKNSGNAKFNFFDMMYEHRNDEYIMLCDQDDVWKKNKIEETYKKIKSVEKKYGKNTPVLVHTDLTVVDEKLNVISQSYKKMMYANYDRTALNNIIIQNTVTGCTAMYNNALAKLLRPVDGYFEMHDWWLAVMASAFGKIEHLDIQTIFYRQHKNNSVGVRNMRSIKFVINYMKKVSEIKWALNITYMQSESFYAAYGDILSKEQKKLLIEYCKIPEMKKLKKIYTIFNLNTFKNGLVRNIGYIIYI